MFGSTKEVGLSVRPMSSARWQRRDFPILERASGVPTRRRLMPSSQGSAIGFAPTRFASPPPGPLPTPGCMMNSPAPLSHREATGFFTLGNAARRRHARTGWVRAASPNPISPRPEIVLDADTMFIPDPILPWVEIRAASQTGDRGMFLPWCGEQTGGDAETRVSGSAELAAPRHPAGPQQAGCLSVRRRRATSTRGIGEAGRCGKGGMRRVRSRRRPIGWPVGATWSSIRSGPRMVKRPEPYRCPVLERGRG